MMEAPWTREELIEFCLKGNEELEYKSYDEYLTELEGMTWEELDKEADWIWELMWK